MAVGGVSTETTQNATTINSKKGVVPAVIYNAENIEIQGGTGVDAKTGKPNNNERPVMPEVYGGMAKFLRTHINRIAEIADEYKNNRTQLNNVFKEHMHDLDLLAILSTNGKADDKKIEAYLKTENGMLTTRELMMHETVLHQYALGLMAEQNPRWSKQIEGDTMTIFLNDGRGFLNKLGVDVIRPQLGRIAAVLSGADLGLLLGGGTVLPGFTGGLSVIGAWVLWRGTIPGLRIKVQRFTDGFNVLKRDPYEKKYLEKMYGVYVDDFRVNGNRVEAIPGRMQRSANIAQFEDDMASTLRTLTDLNKQLHFTRKRKGMTLGVTAEDYLMRGNADFNTRRSAMTWMDQSIDEEFANLVATFGTNPTREERAELYLKARRKVLRKSISDYLKDESIQNERERKRGVIQKMQDALGQTEQGGTIWKSKEEALTKKKSALEAAQPTLQGEVTTLNSYKNSVDELNNNRQNLLNEIRSTKYAGDPTISIRNYLDDLDDALTTLGATVRINGSTIGPVQNLYNTYIGQYNLVVPGYEAAIVGKLTPEKLAEARNNANNDATVQPLRQQYEKAKQLIEQTVHEITSQLQTLQQQESQLVDRRTAPNEASKALNLMADNFTGLADPATGIDAALTAAGGVGTVGLTATVLRSQTIDQIMALINEANRRGRIATNPAEIGWPANRNKEADTRATVIRAMQEAKVRNQEATLPVGAERTRYLLFQSYISTLNIYANDLRVLDVDTLKQKYTALATRPVTEIEDARQAAMEAYNRRLAVLDRQTKQTAAEITDLDDQVKNIDLSEYKARLQTGVDVNLGQDKILGRSQDFLAQDKTRPIEFIAGVPATSTEYTTAEKTLAQPKAYYDFLQMLTGYQDDIANREKNFQKYSKIVTPDFLSKTLNNNLQLGIGVAGSPRAAWPLNMFRVARAIQLDVANSEISMQLMNTALEGTIDQLLIQAMGATP